MNKFKIKIIIIGIIMLMITKTNAQVDNIGHLSNPFWYVGWNNLSVDALNIEHRGTQNINFLTGGIQRATILGTAAGVNAGNLGVGTINPGQMLEISGGNLDLSSFTAKYMLGSTPFLWHNGTTTNVFAGVNAGYNVAQPPTDNTCIGYLTGNSIVTNGGGGNTLIGSNAGRQITTSGGNVIVGYLAGESLSTGYGDNVFIGFKAGNHGYEPQVKPWTQIPPPRRTKGRGTCLPSRCPSHGRQVKPSARGGIVRLTIFASPLIAARKN